MHAGMLRPDSSEAAAMAEARAVARELRAAPDVSSARAPVAIIYDYDASYSWDIQPQGRDLSYFSLVFDAYKAMRALGLSIDILPATARDFAGYGVVLRSEEHTSELQSRRNLVCRLLLEKKKNTVHQ